MMVFDTYPESKLIGISGTLGAGKDTGAIYLMERGFKHVSTGDVLRAEATKRGLDHERMTLINLGVELRNGQAGALVLRAIDEWKTQRVQFSRGLVVSGLRLLGESQEIKDQHGTLLFFDAPFADRRKWLINRGRGTEAGKTLEEFIAHERIEMEGVGDPNRPHLLAVKAIADLVIENTGTKDEFYAKLTDELHL